jgi:hypothetical protein
MTDRVLTAGIGNILLRDDAFGVDVVRPLLTQPLLDGRCGALVLVDALPMNESPGTWPYSKLTSTIHSGQRATPNPVPMRPMGTALTRSRACASSLSSVSASAV